MGDDYESLCEDILNTIQTMLTSDMKAKTKLNVLTKEYFHWVNRQNSLQSRK